MLRFISAARGGGVDTRRWLGLGIALAACGAQAQDGAEAPLIFRSGNWDVHRTVDPMSDASVCTAVYNGQFSIALSENALTIAIPDGVRRVQLRFDSDPALPQREATHSEMRNGRIEITAADFAEVMRSHRLRYEAVTVTHDIQVGDIDLNGAFQAHANVAAGCAGNPIVMPNPPAPPADGCTPELRQRMADQGIPLANIDKICRG
jgi:hypothetical protein